MSSKNVRKTLSNDDFKSGEKFSIFSLDSTFLPTFFNVDNEADPKNFSSKFQNFFQTTGDISSISNGFGN
jgi:hypothetical protein